MVMSLKQLVTYIETYNLTCIPVDFKSSWGYILGTDHAYGSPFVKVDGCYARFEGGRLLIESATGAILDFNHYLAEYSVETIPQKIAQLAFEADYHDDLEHEQFELETHKWNQTDYETLFDSLSLHEAYKRIINKS